MGGLGLARKGGEGLFKRHALRVLLSYRSQHVWVVWGWQEKEGRAFSEQRHLLTLRFKGCPMKKQVPL